MNGIKSTLKSRIEYSKITSIKNKSNPKIKYCVIYLVTLLLILSFFVINYILTKNNFDNNKYILLLPEKTCVDSLKSLSSCVESSFYQKCSNENQLVENCYDETNAVNRICYIYLSELNLCLTNNKQKTQAKQNCNSQFKEVLECAALFKSLHLDKDKLLDILLAN